MANNGGALSGGPTPAGTPVFYIVQLYMRHTICGGFNEAMTLDVVCFHSHNIHYGMCIAPHANAND